jgi:hypothetical protein
VIDCYTAWPLLLISREEKGEQGSERRVEEKRGEEMREATRRGEGMRREEMGGQGVRGEVRREEMRIKENGEERSGEEISYYSMAPHLPDPAPPHDTNFLPIKPSTGWNHSKSERSKEK